MSNKLKGSTTDNGSSKCDLSNSRVDGSVAAELTFDEADMNEAKIWRDKNDDDDFLEDPF